MKYLGICEICGSNVHIYHVYGYIQRQMCFSFSFIHVAMNSSYDKCHDWYSILHTPWPDVSAPERFFKIFGNATVLLLPLTFEQSGTTCRTSGYNSSMTNWKRRSKKQFQEYYQWAIK